MNEGKVEKVDEIAQHHGSQMDPAEPKCKVAKTGRMIQQSHQELRRIVSESRYP